MHDRNEFCKIKLSGSVGYVSVNLQKKQIVGNDAWQISKGEANMQGLQKLREIQWTS